jgi:MFS family permease
MNKRLLLAAAVLFAPLIAMAAPGFNMGDQPGQWWSGRFAALYGGWIGGGLGGIGGIIGSAAGIMARKGKGRRLIVGSMLLLTLVGVAALIGGLVALAGSQPWHVTYPLLLLGVILTAVCGGNTFVLRRVYTQVELRQISARDV